MDISQSGTFQMFKVLIVFFAQLTVFMNERSGIYDIVRPEPEKILQSARSYGYSIETAIADILDNSITAGATQIKIDYGINEGSSFVRIKDNGFGMTEAQLIQAMQFGSFSPLEERKVHDLGRFGLGLKTASFSQCRRLTVKTRAKGQQEFIRCWDLDTIQKEKDWILLRTYADHNSGKNMTLSNSDASGTTVLWEILDRLIEDAKNEERRKHFYRKFENVKKHLGLIFHRFIESESLIISVNGNEVEPVNPFHVSTKYPTLELADTQLSLRKEDIYIQPYILPHESKLSAKELENANLIRGLTEHQGIYLYRERRLILDGTWLDLGFQKKESQRLCRISIDISNVLDKEWQIDVRKASAKVPDVLRNVIKAISFGAIEKAVKVYTHRGAYIKRNNKSKDIHFLWIARQRHGKRFYTPNKKHPLYCLISAYLGDNSQLFDDFMKLIGDALPIGIIVNDFSDTSFTMKNILEEPGNELEEIYGRLFQKLLKAGSSEESAKEKLSKMDCFNALKK